MTGDPAELDEHDGMAPPDVAEFQRQFIRIEADEPASRQRRRRWMGFRPTRAEVDAVSEPMLRPILLYLINRDATGWVVRCETQRYGPYRTFGSAMEAAADEAAAARQAGFASTILIDGGRGQRPTSCPHDAAAQADDGASIPKDGAGH